MVSRGLGVADRPADLGEELTRRRVLGSDRQCLLEQAPCLGVEAIVVEEARPREPLLGVGVSLAVGWRVERRRRRGRGRSVRRGRRLRGRCGRRLIERLALRAEDRGLPAEAGLAQHALRPVVVLSRVREAARPRVDRAYALVRFHVQRCTGQDEAPRGQSARVAVVALVGARLARTTSPLL